MGSLSEFINLSLSLQSSLQGSFLPLEGYGFARQLGDWLALFFLQVCKWVEQYVKVCEDRGPFAGQNRSWCRVAVPLALGKALWNNLSVQFISLVYKFLWLTSSAAFK
jgi:hypothetical protein